ncbi:MAG: hypothetical protein K0R43_1686 [Pseudoduganella sp.]|jgi:hypothetical protein|nr:hypothetical protein [Pseudoduganella sp.]
MNLINAIPAPYRLGLLALSAAALVAIAWAKGAQHVQAKWDAAEGARARAEASAVLARIAENKVEAARQAAANRKITERKDNEIAELTARLNAAGRLRVGSAICGGPPGATQADLPGRGDGADSSAGLVREDVDRDLKALILAVETDLATGRACQAAARDHGLAQ